MARSCQTSSCHRHAADRLCASHEKMRALLASPRTELAEVRSSAAAEAEQAQQRLNEARQQVWEASKQAEEARKDWRPAAQHAALAALAAAVPEAVPAESQEAMLRAHALMSWRRKRGVSHASWARRMPRWVHGLRLWRRGCLRSRRAWWRSDGVPTRRRRRYRRSRHARPRSVRHSYHRCRRRVLRPQWQRVRRWRCSRSV